MTTDFAIIIGILGVLAVALVWALVVDHHRSTRPSDVGSASPDSPGARAPRNRAWDAAVAKARNRPNRVH